MGAHVHVPVRIRLAASALEGRDGCLCSAVGAGVERALARSRATVLAPRGGYSGVRVHAPDFTWRGDTAVTAAQRARIEALIRESFALEIERARLLTPSDERARTPLSARAVERFDPRRGNDWLGRYKLPSYNGPDETETLDLDAEPGGAAPETRTVARWLERASNWPDSRDYPDLVSDEQDAFDALHMSYPAGQPLGLAWLQRNAENPLRLYVRNLPNNESRYLQFPLFTIYSPTPHGNSVVWTPHLGLPEPAPMTIEWLTMDAVQTAIRAAVETQARQIAKPENFSHEEFDAVLQAAIENEFTRRMAVAGSHTDAMAISISGLTEYYVWDVPIPRWSGAAYVAPLFREIERPAQEEREGTGLPGGEGEGEGEGGGEGTGPRGGRRGRGRGGFVDTGEEGREAGEGPRFPSSGRGTAVRRCDAAFEGEPSLDELDEAAAAEIRRLMADIANRLDIVPCDYAGQFCLVAAALVGARAVGVADFSVAEGHGQMLQPPRRRAPQPGVIDFTPIATPALQFLRHLARVVPRLTRLSSLVTSTYQQPQHARRIRGFRANNPIGWALDFGAEYHVTMKRAVEHHYIVTVQVVFMQLLHQSRLQIDARRNPTTFPEYARFFEEVVRGDLLPEQELEDLRAQLIHTVGTGSAGRDLVVGVIDRWRTARGALMDVLEGRNPFAHVGEGARGEIVLGENGVHGIRDSNGTIWTLPQLERAIALRRDVATSIDPLVHQLTADPRIRERFTRDPSRIRDELAILLDEMADINAEVRERVSSDRDYAMRLAPISTDYEHQTLPGSGYQLSGVHLLAHHAVGEFFEGDLYYTFGVGDALQSEEGRQMFLTVVELGTIIVVSIFCAPLGLIVGAAFAVYHEVEASHKMDAYRALIDPEIVFNYAELEAELFAADLGLVLSFIPLGRWWGRAATGAGRRLVAGEVRAAARYAVRHVTRTITLATLRALRQNLIVAFVQHVLAFQVISALMGRMLEPVMEEIVREHMSLEQLLELSGEVEAA